MTVAGQSVGVRCVLERLPWELFGSYTTQERGVSDDRLKKLWFAHLRRVCDMQDVDYHEVPFALRIESGEAIEHRHFHALVSGLGHMHTSLRMVMVNDWRTLVRQKRPRRFRTEVDQTTGKGITIEIPYGTAVVRAYSAQRGAAAYISGAKNAYELAQYSKEGPELFLSTAAWRLLNELPTLEGSPGESLGVPVREQSLHRV